MRNHYQNSLKDQISHKARDLGFSAIKFTDPKIQKSAFKDFKVFIKKGLNGSMSWLENNVEWRGNPKLMWKNVNSVIVLAETYGQKEDPLSELKQKGNGYISIYARGEDYHKVMKKKIKMLAKYVIEAGSRYSQTEVKVFVDTAAIMEKHLAQRSGLGWQGKHTNLVSSELGNWFFLGTIFTNLKLSLDNKGVDRCGKCSRCLEICPTNAFLAPYKLDASRCISYLTIEHKGPVDPSLRSLMGNRIYGCDDCLAVCPWNKFSKRAQEIKYSELNKGNTDLKNLAKLSDKEFRERFSKSPIKRIGRGRFVRNVLYAIGNSGNINLANTVNGLINDEDPTVSDAARWALKELGKKDAV